MLVLVVTVHHPHLIAYPMVGWADGMRRVTDSEGIKYSAAWFRDVTRIAASDPTMWRDVFLTNKDATLEILGRFTEELFALQRAIRTGDGAHLHAYFTRTRAIRRGIIEAGQGPHAPDLGRGPRRPRGVPLFTPDPAARVLSSMNTLDTDWPSDLQSAPAALPDGHAFTVPDVLFAKITDDQREDWATRFAGTRS